MHGGGTEFQLTLKAAQGDMPATTIEVPHQTLRGTCDCSSLWLRRMQHALPDGYSSRLLKDTNTYL